MEATRKAGEPERKATKRKATQHKATQHTGAVVDLARERRLRALDAKARALLEGKPELAARTRAALRGEIAMGKQEKLITLRLPAELVRRADALLSAMERDAETVIAAGRVSRSTVLRLALAKGIEALERKHGDSPHYGRGKAKS